MDRLGNTLDASHVAREYTHQKRFVTFMVKRVVGKASEQNLVIKIKTSTA